MRFELEKRFLKNVENPEDHTNEKEVIDKERLDALRKAYSSIPDDFFDYLSEIGAGNIRECQFKVQSYLFDFEDLGLEDVYEVPESIKFFGDNYAGDFAGFDFERNDGKVVEFWHVSAELYYTDKSFQQYIREQMLMDENGNDLCER
jgi:hypothetical protein